MFLRPFESALFYAPAPIHREGNTVQNSKVTYSFFSRTIGSSLIPGLNEAKRFRKFTTGLLRTVESVLRDCTDFPWSIQKGRLPKNQLALIEKQCLAFYKERLAEQKRREKRVFLVDNEVLGQLKTDSEQIRRHLIQQQEQSREEWRSEYGEEVEALPYDRVEAGAFIKDPDEYFNEDFEEELEEDFDEELEEDSADDLAEDLEENLEGELNPFFLLFSRLTAEQRQVLALLCTASPSCALSDAEILQELRRIAFASNTFPNVIMEAINELAVDCAGDCIIDSSGAVPSLFPDYYDQIKEILSDDGK